MGKRPFDIDRAIERIRGAVRPFRKAAMFELADEGFVSPFEQLVACMISIRTLDGTELPSVRILFEDKNHACWIPREGDALASNNE